MKVTYFVIALLASMVETVKISTTSSCESILAVEMLEPGTPKAAISTNGELVKSQDLNEFRNNERVRGVTPAPPNDLFNELLAARRGQSKTYTRPKATFNVETEPLTAPDGKLISPSSDSKKPSSAGGPKPFQAEKSGAEKSIPSDLKKAASPKSGGDKAGLESGGDKAGLKTGGDKSGGSKSDGDKPGGDKKASIGSSSGGGDTATKDVSGGDKDKKEKDSEAASASARLSLLK